MVFVENITSHQAVVAERLRRLTRNQIPTWSVGSNPTDRDNILFSNDILFLSIRINVTSFSSISSYSNSENDLKNVFGTDTPVL